LAVAKDQGVPTNDDQETIGAVQMGTAIISTGSSGHDAQLSDGALSLSGLQTGVGILGIAKISALPYQLLAKSSLVSRLA
jgi:hypothetical protein